MIICIFVYRIHYTHVCIYIYIHTHVYACVYVCIYIYIAGGPLQDVHGPRAVAPPPQGTDEYTCMYIYIYIYTRICIYL